MTTLFALIQFSVQSFGYIPETRKRTLKFDKRLWQGGKASKLTYEKQ